MYMCIVSQHELERLVLKRSHKMWGKSKNNNKKRVGFSGNITFLLHSADVCVYTCGHPTPVTFSRKKLHLYKGLHNRFAVIYCFGLHK